MTNEHTTSLREQTVSVAPLRITLALGSALLLQSAAALLWAGSAAERLSQLEEKVDGTSLLIERTARLEEQVAQMRVTLDRIDRRLDLAVPTSQSER